jgi:hypothetical protein
LQYLAAANETGDQHQPQRPLLEESDSISSQPTRLKRHTWLACGSLSVKRQLCVSSPGKTFNEFSSISISASLCTSAQPHRHRFHSSVWHMILFV